MAQAYNYVHDFTNKRRNINQLNSYMLNKTLSMFEYENLPETIPGREMEKHLQMGGYTFITEFKGDLYAVQGGLGGIPDAYGQPTKIIIANPYLDWNAELDIEEDGVLIRNDDLMTGVLPLYERFNTLLVENDINMLLHGYGTRMKTLISASDDTTKESADEYMKKLIAGEPSIIGESAMFDGIKVHSGGDAVSSASSLIEMTQYLKASLYSEVGISTNFNMKKARLIVDEVEQQQDGAFPYVYSMMKNRILAFRKVNEKYGTNIKVDFGSVWNVQNRRFADDVIEEGKQNELNPQGYDDSFLYDDSYLYDDSVDESLPEIEPTEEQPVANTVVDREIEGAVVVDATDETEEVVADPKEESILVTDEVDPLTDNELDEDETLVEPVVEDVVVEEPVNEEIKEIVEDLVEPIIDEIVEAVEPVVEDIVVEDEEVIEDIVVETDEPVTEEDESVEEILTSEPVTDEDESVEEILADELEVEEPVAEEVIAAVEDVIEGEEEEIVIDSPDEESAVLVKKIDADETEVEKDINNSSEEENTQEKEKDEDETE